MGIKEEWTTEDGGVRLLLGDCIERMGDLPDASVNCCVTSPPYWGLRDYGHEGQIGLEKTPEEYVARMVEVFREVRRVLRDDGTLWLNLGDSYSGSWGNYGGQNRGKGTQRQINTGSMADQKAYAGLENWRPPTTNVSGCKAKDLVGIPWMVAFALRADGWYLRQDIIWHKPNPMPESVTDRCTKSHEYIFLLSKSARYYYDAEAVKEDAVADHPPGNVSPHKYADQNINANGSYRMGTGLTAYAQKQRARGGKNAFRGQGSNRDAGNGHANRDGRDMAEVGSGETRNRRSVWTVATKPFKGAHFATFPTDLIEPCIIAGCPEGGTVLDPFNGSGTTGEVAVKHGRRYVGCELNPDYVALSLKRIGDELDKTRLIEKPQRLVQRTLLGE